MTDALNPFTESDFDEIESKLNLANETEKAIAKAKAAGIDTGDLLVTLRESRTKLQQILRTYKTS